MKIHLEVNERTGNSLFELNLAEHTLATSLTVDVDTCNVSSQLDNSLTRTLADSSCSNEVALSSSLTITIQCSFADVQLVTVCLLAVTEDQRQLTSYGRFLEECPSVAIHFDTFQTVVCTSSVIYGSAVVQSVVRIT